MPQNTGIEIRDALIALPVLGTALAVTYDVGYFWGLDINFFTTFSLTEHIAFALEYIPFALGLSTLAIVLPFAIQLGARHGQKSREHQALTGRSTPFYKSGANWFLFVYCLWNIWLFWYSRSATSIVMLGFTIGIVTLFSFRITPAHLMALISSTVIFAFVLAFAVGLDRAKDYSNSQNYHQTIIPMQGAPIIAKIVRSGDRGLLFFDKNTKALVLLPWNQIKEVSSAP